MVELSSYTFLCHVSIYIDPIKKSIKMFLNFLILRVWQLNHNAKKKLRKAFESLFYNLN